jgi:2-C-methyl-D-erythritol 4-phosphate cytidylyltransferase
VEVKVSRRDTVVLVPAAGVGHRLGPGEPKALRLLAGEPLLVHAVRRLACAPSVAAVVVAAPVGQVGQVRRLLAKVTGDCELVVVAGGVVRQESVRLALRAAPAGLEIVLVHDAARCLVPPSLVEAVVAGVRSGADAVVPVLPVVDTIKSVDTENLVIATVDRHSLRAVQTPQGFRREVLLAAQLVASGADPVEQVTDDAGLVERAGGRVLAVDGAEEAMKVTRPLDLVVAAALLEREAPFERKTPPGQEPSLDRETLLERETPPGQEPSLDRETPFEPRTGPCG